MAGGGLVDAVPAPRTSTPRGSDLVRPLMGLGLGVGPRRADAHWWEGHLGAPGRFAGGRCELKGLNEAVLWGGGQGGGRQGRPCPGPRQPSPRQRYEPQRVWRRPSLRKITLVTNQQPEQSSDAAHTRISRSTKVTRLQMNGQGASGGHPSCTGGWAFVQMCGSGTHLPGVCPAAVDRELGGWLRSARGQGRPVWAANGST